MVLFLNASPRKHGVTSTLLRIMAEEASSGGAEVEWIDVNNLSIRPCIGCLKCRPDKKCILSERRRTSCGRADGKMLRFSGEHAYLLGQHDRPVETSF